MGNFCDPCPLLQDRGSQWLNPNIFYSLLTLWLLLTSPSQKLGPVEAL
jgi:hypothetical protein